MPDTNGLFVSSRHGEIIVSLCEVFAFELNPALRLDVAVARCPPLARYGTREAGIPLAAFEYIVRERMLAENARNEESLVVGAHTSSSDEKARSKAALDLLGDSDYVVTQAMRLRVTVGTYVVATLRERCGSAWEVAFRGVFAALSTPSPLHSAIESGDYQTATTLARTHPTWSRWKHRGMLPLHAAVTRAANFILEEETGELLPLTETLRRQRQSLVEALIEADPTSVHVRTDSNWSLGVANGLTALQLAVTSPTDSARGANYPAPPLDLGVVATLLKAGGPSAMLCGAPRVYDDRAPPDFCAKRTLETELGVLASSACASYADQAEWLSVIVKYLCEAAEVKGSGDAPSRSIFPDEGAVEQTKPNNFKGSDGGESIEGRNNTDGTVTTTLKIEAHPAHGGDLTCDELKARLGEKALCELLSLRFFEEFEPHEQQLLFQLAALTRSLDCINTPSRFTAELDVAERGESALEAFLSGLRVRYVNEAETRVVAERLAVAHVVTPDAVFPNEPAVIPGVPCPIRWVDSKNGWFVPGLSPEVKLASLRRQVLKYAHHVGEGLVLWHKGYFESVLDGCPSCVMHATVTYGSGGELRVVECRRGKGVLATRSVSIAAARVGMLIGRQGERVKSIEADFGVYIVIPCSTSGGSDGAGTSSGGRGDKVVVKIVACSDEAAQGAELFIREIFQRSGARSTPRRARSLNPVVGTTSPCSFVPPQLARRADSLPLLAAE